ncbi:alpha/beta-hydrolase [Wilcoxina mikolae CBS 423.85]|nr:alpha/beta-hydrolase [Wilcoxina mikolae CBS 423.85]
MPPNNEAVRLIYIRPVIDFTRAAKLSHCAYMPTCNSPVGTTRIYTIRNDTYDTDGFISRDDKRREIIVAMRGTTTQADVTVDLDNALVQSTLPGSEGCIGCTVHQGFQHQWSAVANDVVRIVRAQLQLYPFYSITVTGHSLGGALTTLAAVTLGKAFPGKVTAYSLASPRTGNPAWINWVESTIPLPKLFRLTNQNDTVPNDLTEAEGYKHHRTEFWSPVLPVTPDNMVICDGGEDPHCNKV